MTRIFIAALAATSLLAACSSEDSTPAASPTPTPTGSPTPTPTPAAVTCAELCTAVTTTCVAPNLQFADATQCNTWCGTSYGWPAGTRGATSGNTIACRLTHAGLAASPGPASTHCPHAGPTGGGACGSLCENYCDAAVRNCTTTNAIFADRAACITACGSATAAGGTISTTGAVNATGGNNIQCRIWHLAQAQANPGLHCPHAQIVSSATIGGAANGPCN